MTVTSENVPRFIPAGAGNTSPPDGGDALMAVYPRWRGEHGFGFFTHIYLTGLSPLARGTHRLHPAKYLDRRFIPAGAGNTAPTVTAR